MAADRSSHLTPLSAQDVLPAAQDQSLQHLVETADYVSQRTLQLDEQVHEVEQILQHLAALARQLRTLSSNTMLEAHRMRTSGPLAEIARQMRRISQQISESNDQLSGTLRGYAAATGELHQAATTLLGDLSRSYAASESMASPTPFPVLHPRPAQGAPVHVPGHAGARAPLIPEDDP